MANHRLEDRAISFAYGEFTLSDLARQAAVTAQMLKKQVDNYDDLVGSSRHSVREED